MARAPRRRKLPRIPKARRSGVTRDEFNRAIEILNQRSAILEEHGAVLSMIQRDLETQFRRIAQIQQELDALTKALSKLT